MTAQLFAALRKDATLSDVHVTTALGNEGGKKRAKMFRAFLAGSGYTPTQPVEVETAKRDGEWSLSLPIVKTDDDMRVAYGWASVTEEGGRTVTDQQGDQIDVPDLIDAAHDFMLSSRNAGDMHDVMGVGKVVESMVFSPDVQKALGIELGKVGWFIAMKISDADVWTRVKSGELGAFSIGGMSRRVPV